MNYQEFREAAKLSTRMRPGSIMDLSLTEGRLITDVVYKFQELVSPGRDVVFSFFIPEGTIKINRLKLNLYFPGLQVSDYPQNSNILYLPALNKGTPAYQNGSFDSFGQNYYQVGTGAGGSYWWYRAFCKFNISPLAGLKLKTCTLNWLLASKAFAGTGPNAQHSSILHAINDYGILDKADWGMTAQVNYGTVNVYTDPDGDVYSKDVKARVQSLVDNGDNYAAFRFVSDSEPTDTANANNYRYNDPILYCELEEDVETPVGLYANDGAGFGEMLNSYKGDIEEVDITARFSGTGKKQIKFSATRMRRIEAILRMAIKQKGGAA